MHSLQPADDEGPQFVLPDSTLLALARAAPADAAGVLDVLHMHAPEPALHREDLMSKAPFKQVCCWYSDLHVWVACSHQQHKALCINICAG